MISNIRNRLKTKLRKVYIPIFKGRPLALPFFQLWQKQNKPKPIRFIHLKDSPIEEDGCPRCEYKDGDLI